MDRGVLSQKLPIPQCQPARAIYMDHTLVILPYFNHDAGLVPFQRMWPGLVLDADMIADNKRWKPFGVLRPAFRPLHVTVAKGLFSCLQGFTPGVVWLVFARGNWDEILDRVAKDAHGWRELRVPVWGIAILKYGPLKVVCIQGSSSASVFHNESFNGLHSNLSSTVAVGKGNRGEAMMDTPVGEEMACSYCREFRATIRGQLIRNAESGKDAT